jgi:hypothetical protein
MARRLSDAEKLTAEWLAKETKQYGPLSRNQIENLAAQYRAMETDSAHKKHRRGNGMLTYGLETIANEMTSDEKVTGAVPWWKRL